MDERALLIHAKSNPRPFALTVPFFGAGSGAKGDEQGPSEEAAPLLCPQGVVADFS
ncbi:hypothetical protein SAMD00023353_4300380 [Rosellinia necatrix]|uniref:Uncharacterized protein n=1 Tax=Rosellinia necatrix TaxID=77044 RepID=A0A1S8A996_ROSNE|nr:hypothetical protein SAMD00023353_4300380 [Rosellinia necatrix]